MQVWTCLNSDDDNNESLQVAQTEYEMEMLPEC